jgi:hypothetical protein
MSKPQDPYANRGPVEVTSVSTAIKFSPPMPWIQIRSAGSGGLVVKSEDGTSRTFTNLLAGDVLRGPFSELTSMTVTRLWYGDGEPPTSTLAASSTVNGASAPAGSGLTAGNVLQVTAATALAYGPVNLAGGPNFVTGVAPLATTAAQQTTTFTAALDVLYQLALTSAAVINLPALSGTEIHKVHFFNPSGSAAVITPNTGTPDLIAVSGGTTGATAAGPTAGKMQTWVGMAAVNRWVVWG